MSNTLEQEITSIIEEYRQGDLNKKQLKEKILEFIGMHDYKGGHQYLTVDEYTYVRSDMKCSDCNLNRRKTEDIEKLSANLIERISNKEKKFQEDINFWIQMTVLLALLLVGLAVYIAML